MLTTSLVLGGLDRSHHAANGRRRPRTLMGPAGSSEPRLVLSPGAESPPTEVLPARNWLLPEWCQLPFIDATCGGGMPKTILSSRSSANNSSSVTLGFRDRPRRRGDPDVTRALSHPSRSARYSAIRREVQAVADARIGPVGLVLEAPAARTSGASWAHPASDPPRHGGPAAEAPGGQRRAGAGGPAVPLPEQLGRGLQQPQRIGRMKAR